MNYLVSISLAGEIKDKFYFNESEIKEYSSWNRTSNDQYFNFIQVPKPVEFDSFSFI
jgi:hypothetical protein